MLDYPEQQMIIAKSAASCRIQWHYLPRSIRHAYRARFRAIGVGNPAGEIPSMGAEAEAYPRHEENESRSRLAIKTVGLSRVVFMTNC
jgi:hypothetical protein